MHPFLSQQVMWSRWNEECPGGYNCISNPGYIQWNLRIVTALGTGPLALVERSVSSQRFSALITQVQRPYFDVKNTAVPVGFVPLFCVDFWREKSASFFLTENPIDVPSLNFVALRLHIIYTCTSTKRLQLSSIVVSRSQNLYLPLPATRGGKGLAHCNIANGSELHRKTVEEIRPHSMNLIKKWMNKLFQR